MSEFELPEFATLAEQMNDTLRGKVVRGGQLGDNPHKCELYWVSKPGDYPTEKFIPQVRKRSIDICLGKYQESRQF